MNPKKGSARAERTRLSATQKRPIFARLVRMLDESGLPDAAFARKYGLPHSTPGKWREGKRDPAAGAVPSGDLLAHLAHETGVSPSWLLTGRGPTQLARVVEAETVHEALAGYIAGEVLHELESQWIRVGTIGIDAEGAVRAVVELAVGEARALIEWAPTAVIGAAFSQLPRDAQTLERIESAAPGTAGIIRDLTRPYRGLGIPLNQVRRDKPATRIVTTVGEPSGAQEGEA